MAPGNNNFLAANSSSFTLTLGPPPPTISLADATMPLNGSTTLTATVTPPSGRVPTCSNCLQFKEGATLATATTFATVSVTETSSGSGVYHAQTTVSGGSTAFPTISDPVFGLGTVYAPSGGTGNPGQSSDDVGGPAASPSATVSVTARVTSVQITAGNTTGSIGGEESFTVTVTPSGATGTVKLFADDGNGGGPVEVDSDTLTSGSASLQFTAANADTYTLTATYTSNDTANYASDGTSNTHTITINPLAVTVTVAANDSAGPITVTAGASVTLKATLNYTSTITGPCNLGKRRRLRQSRQPHRRRRHNPLARRCHLWVAVWHHGDLHVDAFQLRKCQHVEFGDCQHASATLTLLAPDCRHRYPPHYRLPRGSFSG
ncbi:Ig-like domain-containing protein [Candidatus Amarobacter glycogenicus]|uniref:Ig-like domain-containing protein n=1 Tax=Candidatus Amarobacter glycogenicus TaxID=3140699 RepID=UPI002A12F768|nr:Ig-like domain repeat protein [Dehalococcoidia bacterium]